MNKQTRSTKTNGAEPKTAPVIHPHRFDYSDIGWALAELRGLTAVLKGYVAYAKSDPADEELDWTGVERMIDRAALLAWECQSAWNEREQQTAPGVQ